MKKSDRALGMDRAITRRDFIHDTSLAALGITLASGALPVSAATASGNYYPPTRTGMRGSHPGSFEIAHAIGREGKAFSKPADLDEEYDLVIVGGGISGLAAAHYYRRLHGADSRILILDNHDDFGGHAKRNEFHHNGRMSLSWGGTMNLEYPYFSDTSNALLEELGVDIDTLLKGYDFGYGRGPKGQHAVYFDAETYGKDTLVMGLNFRNTRDIDLDAKIDQMPIDNQSRDSLKAFFRMRTDVFEGMSAEERSAQLSGMSYVEFLKKHGGLTDAAADLFVQTTHGYWGVGADSLSVAECKGAGLPMMHLLGEDHFSGSGNENVGGDVAMFPDGNASIARLLVHQLIPEVAPGTNAANVAMQTFDYSQLDRPENTVRIRLSSTAVNVDEAGGEVSTSYVRDGKLVRVKSRQSILACYHVIIPHLCPQLPDTQKEALKDQVKRPLLLTNVWIRDSKAFDKLNLSGAYCPGRLHGAFWQIKGVNTGGYEYRWDEDGAVPVMFWGQPRAIDSSVDVRTQHRAQRAAMLAMTFEDYEREVRTVLDGMLGPGGFKVKDDVLAITVNRWPHGYSYDYLDLFDPEFPPGEAPNEIARKAFGNIAIANSDAGASALSNIAIDEAWRAVNELPG